MYDICHPTYYNMSQLGCNDQVKLTTSFYVYMELCEVKRYWDVKYKYCESLQLFYLEARKKKNTAIETFIPWPAISNLTLDFISNIQQQLKKDKFTFIFKDGDTSSVYYSICAGIVKPKSPEEMNIIKQKEEKKFNLDNAIRRNAANLYERALLFSNGEKVQDTKCSHINVKVEKSETVSCDTSLKTSSDKKNDSNEPKISSDCQKSIVDSKKNTNSIQSVVSANDINSFCNSQIDNADNSIPSEIVQIKSNDTGN